MTPFGGGQKPDPTADKSLGEIVAEISEKASLLVREEVELAKTEVIQKAKTLGRGAAVAVAAGVFVTFAVIMLLFTAAFLIDDALGTSVVWPGFLIVTIFFLILGVIAGVLAKRWLSAGPPTPDQAIEEAKITREAFDDIRGQSDQVKGTLGAGDRAAGS